MKIGHISKRSYKAGEEIKSYLEMIVRPPMMESATFTVSSNDKKNPNEPDYNIWYSFNRKGERYPSTKVGALWNKESDSGVKYKNGSIECPAVPGGKLSISIFEAKVKEGENIDWSHDVLWSPPRAQESGGYSDGGYAAPYTPPPVVYEKAPGSNGTPPEIDINEDEITF